MSDNNKSPICTNCFHSKDKHIFEEGHNDHHCQEFGCTCIQYREE